MTRKYLSSINLLNKLNGLIFCAFPSSFSCGVRDATGGSAGINGGGGSYLWGGHSEGSSRRGSGRSWGDVVLGLGLGLGLG